MHHLSLFTIPASIASQSEKMMRDFLWFNNDQNNDFHYHYIKWDDVFHPKQHGGLCIRPICAMNQPLKSQHEVVVELRTLF